MILNYEFQINFTLTPITGNPANVRNQCRGEPYVRPPDKNRIKPMFENEFETIASDIGTQTIVVRRANIRFAPTLVLLIGLISVFVRRANIFIFHYFIFDQQ